MLHVTLSRTDPYITNEDVYECYKALARLDDDIVWTLSHDWLERNLPYRASLGSCNEWN